MSTIQNSLPSASRSSAREGDDGTSKIEVRQPSVQRQNDTQLQQAADKQVAGDGQGNPQNGFDKIAQSIATTRNWMNTPRLWGGTASQGINLAEKRGLTQPSYLKYIPKFYGGVGLPIRLADLPMRATTTAHDLTGKDKSATEKGAGAAKMVATTVETLTDAADAVKNAKEGSGSEQSLVPFERNAPTRRNVATTENQSPPAREPFSREDPSRMAVRPKSQPAPRMPTPKLAASAASELAKVPGMLPKIGAGAGTVGGALDFYFGAKQVSEEKEWAGKLQGVLSAASGMAGVGASAASLAEMLGIESAAAYSGSLALGSTGLAAAAATMAVIPAIHERDNTNRGIKLFNEVSHELKQMNEADKQFSQRVHDDLAPTLNDLQNRYGLQTRNVWLNNNAADFLNQVNSQNNTTSGQWKADESGQYWSNFRDKYIHIPGTHQDEVTLDLPAEKDGSHPIAEAADSKAKEPVDSDPTKTPEQLKSRAAESARYDEEGWSASTAQPSVTKRYGYDTSKWGLEWDTHVPFAMDAGPSYLSHAVSKNGQDTVVLINDTRVETPDKPVPTSGYSEHALFANDGKDGERMTASQVATVISENKEPVVDGKFNVAASAEKSAENAYREAVYPLKDGTSYIRYPDPFERKIVTNPEQRTVVSLQNITHPVRIVMQNERDVVDMPKLPTQSVHISLPPLPAGTVDQRQWGSSAPQLRPVFKEQTVKPAQDGRPAIYTNTYTFGDGASLTVEADDVSRINRFVGAS